MNTQFISGRFKPALPILLILGTAGGLSYWYFANRVPPVPRRTLRIGFEPNPPFQIRTESGFSGIAVEIVDDAAKRAGLRLQWVQTGLSSEASFQKGLVDLWPLMADLPERRKYLHFSRPWLHSSHVLLLPPGTAMPDRNFSGRIALFKLPLHFRFAHEEFPEAQLLPLPDSQDVLKQVCSGAADAGFLEGRVAMTALRARPPECGSAMLRAQAIPGQAFNNGVASTFEAAGAAEALRREIDTQFRDGTLAVTMAKYSYYGLDDTWATYDLMEAVDRARWTAWGTGALAVALILALWQALSHRQRKQAERVLRESEERFRTMADTAPVMIWVAGPDKLLTFFNKTWLDFTGRTMEQELGNGWADGVHPEDKARCYESYCSAFDARRTFHLEHRLRRADGEYRRVLCTGVPRFERGAFAGYIGSDTDITDLRRAQEEDFGRQKLESLGVLTSGIAHDFNNLLGGILASTELMLTERADGSPLSEEELARIRTAAIRGGEIVRQLMIYGGEQNQALEPVDISRLVGEMLQLLKVSISKRAELRVRLPERLPAVRANAAQIRQVVLNLVVNASEALEGKSGNVDVSTARIHLVPGAGDARPGGLRDGEYVLLQVSDTGCGMTEEVKARIFDPFFSTKFLGRGMGLAAVQGIVRGQGGAIRVTSAPGKGSTFEVWLPCSSGPAKLDGERSLPPALSMGSATVLLVDDEEALRFAVASALKREGFAVLEAANGLDAVQLFASRHREIDVVVLDVTMPGLSGHDVSDEIRRLQPEVRVLFTTAHDAAERDDRASAGGERILRKPYHLRDLVRTLREMLG